MEKGKRLFSYFGSIFAFCMLALAVFLPGIKAEAALTVKEINYENSTITIKTDAPDQVLYFSDKNKKKWEMATDSFATKDGEMCCTMDISWISVTKNYVLTFKGDKSEEILEVTIPKQVSDFKAKYDKKESKVTFVNDNGRDVQYRKNNTVLWTDVLPDDQTAFSNALKRLCENGAKVYFRLKAQNGSASDSGNRYSKESVCTIPKKTAAPKITVNNDATISVTPGLQVRCVSIKEGTGIQYVTGYEKIDSVKEEDVDTEQWYTYRVEKDIPVVKMDQRIAADDSELSTGSSIYLQFRKAATSSAQVSHITTVAIPKQEAAPDKSVMQSQYTSPTTVKLTIPDASTKTPYEFCAVDESDVKEENGEKRIIDVQSAVWKTISSNVPMEVKKSEAPNNCWIFFRKKAVGNVGSDDFRLATDYTAFEKIVYPGEQDGDVTVAEPVSGGWITRIDGQCTEDNAKQYIKFTVNTRYNAKIAKIGFSTSKNPTFIGNNTATVTSTVAKSGGAYIITATIKSLNLSDTLKEQLKEPNQEIPLYAYIQLNTSGDVPAYITSDGEKGLKIKVQSKSYIETALDSSDPRNKLDVTRIIGSTTASAISAADAELYDSFWFKIHFGSSGRSIASVKLGNCEVKDSCALSLLDGKFTVNMESMEQIPQLEPYYGTKQNLVITLDNGEELTGATIKLVEPVSLKSVYSWAFRQGGLPATEQTITEISGGTTITKKEYINKYSAEYVKTEEKVNGIGVKSVSLVSASLTDTDGSHEILYAAGVDNVIEFSNNALNTLKPITSQPVKIKFKITLTNGMTYEYTIDDGCKFTILS